MRDRFKIHNAPDTIWLVYGDIEQDCNHGDCDEVTWCTAPQYEADIEYIRASEVAGDKAELAALRVEVERLQARVAELEEAVAIEREACAQICDSVNNHDNPMTASDCAAAIRARGEKP